MDKVQIALMYIDLPHFVCLSFAHIIYYCCARIVCTWQYNSSRHRGVGNTIPYQLVFGQVPQVGISHLPLAPALIASLNTEAQYRHALLRIEDDGVMMPDVGIDDGTEQLGDESNVDLLHAEEGSFFIADGTVDNADSQPISLSNPPPPPSSGRKINFLTISIKHISFTISFLVLVSLLKHSLHDLRYN